MTGDRLAIVDVLNRYATALDRRDWPLLDRVFTPDVTVEFGFRPTRTREEAVAIVREYLETCGPTQHLLGNYRVELDGDRAESVCNVRAFHVGSGDAAGKTYEMGGEYHDRLVRTPQGWRIARRAFNVIFEVGSREVLGR